MASYGESRDEGSGKVDTMSGTGTAGQTPSTTATTQKRPLSIALWALQVKGHKTQPDGRRGHHGER
jgi:hypothetical protein